MSLTVVPTPIGNLGDFSSRAVEVLKSVDQVLSEDTRVTRKLFSHFGIENKLIPFHQHNEHKVLERILADLSAGINMALVSDAGTPGISDPGFLLVRAAIEADVEVICLPGATAFVPALVVSGLPCDRFVFEGFLPHKKGRQKRWLSLEKEERTMVFYESPYRLIKFLEELNNFLGQDRRICVSREISKMYEEHVRGNAGEVLERLKNKTPKGEYVVVVEGFSA